MRKFGLNFLSAATGGVRRLPKKYFLSARRRRVPRARSRHRHREVPALSARALADHRGAAASAQHQPEYRGQLPGAAVSRRAWIICVNFKRSASSPQWRCSCTRTAQPFEHMLIASPSSSSSARAHRRRLEYRKHKLPVRYARVSAGTCRRGYAGRCAAADLNMAVALNTA